jgi:3-oxoacyl-[acyl-carrier protein] reductase
LSNKKIALVTGGANNLGLEIANELKDNNFEVIIFDIDEKRLDKLKNEFIVLKVDVTNEKQIQESVNNIISKYKKIDILVNNAGVIYSEPLINIMNPNNMRHSYESFQKMIKINLDSVFLMSSIVIETMIKSRTKGVIVNISSISANGNAGQSAYSAAKAGVEAMTKTWAKELGGFGIRSVAIAPGFIDTDSTSKALNDKTIKHIKSNTPLKRLGQADDISKTVLFIINNNFVNGTIISIDGGLVI